MAGEYGPVKARNVDRSIALLQRCQHSDYLFLARSGRCRLSDLPVVYEPGTAANQDWLACRRDTARPVTALYLHVDQIVDGAPWGSVTLLDGRKAAADVYTISTMPESQRERQARLLVKRYQGHIRYCSTLEAIQYLRSGGECQWM